VTGAVELIEIDDVTAAALGGRGAMRVQCAAGFPRSEDLEALRARERGALSFLIAADGVVVGTCGTHGPPNADGVVELGWGLVAAARGRGVGTTAVTALLDAAVRRYPHASFVAHTEWSDVDGDLLADSEASEAILRRLGFAPAPVPSEPGYRAWRLGH
jgi:RimJ/RimL family protein N-acetyltransferase